MGFFARLGWLLFGTGEAPSSYKGNSAKPHDAHRRPQGQDRDHRGPRGEGRDHRGGNFNRERGEGRDHRGPRGEGRDRGHREGGRHERGEGRGEGRGERGDHRGGRGGHREGGHHGRRDANQDFERIQRPQGGSTMRPTISSAPVAVATPAPAQQSQQGPEKIGAISNYDEAARSATLRIERGAVRVGDWIEIQGHVSTLRQKVDSIQSDGQMIPEAREGQEVILRVIRPVKAGDGVVRLRG